MWHSHSSVLLSRQHRLFCCVTLSAVSLSCCKISIFVTAWASGTERFALLLPLGFCAQSWSGVSVDSSAAPPACGSPVGRNPSHVLDPQLVPIHQNKHSPIKSFELQVRLFWFYKDMLHFPFGHLLLRQSLIFIKHCRLWNQAWGVSSFLWRSGLSFSIYCTWQKASLWQRAGWEKDTFCLTNITSLHIFT